MVEPIYCLKPAWCGRHLAGLRPETGLTVRYGATAFKAVGCHFPFLLVTKPRPLHFQLAVGERHPTILRTVPADIPTDLSRRLLPGHVLRAQRQNCSMVLRPIELITSSTATLA